MHSTFRWKLQKLFVDQILKALDALFQNLAEKLDLTSATKSYIQLNFFLQIAKNAIDNIT